MKKSSLTEPTLTQANALDAHLGFWLRFVSNQVSSRFEKRLEERGITVSEWVAMRTLYDRPNTTHAELIEALGMTKGAASKVITRLEVKGLAVRHLAEDKAREQVLSLTASGRQLLPALAALADENDHFFFGHLEASQRAQLMKAMKELVAHHNFKSVPVK